MSRPVYEHVPLANVVQNLAVESSHVCDGNDAIHEEAELLVELVRRCEVSEVGHLKDLVLHRAHNAAGEYAEGLPAGGETLVFDQDQTAGALGHEQGQLQGIKKLAEIRVKRLGDLHQIKHFEVGSLPFEAALVLVVPTLFLKMLAKLRNYHEGVGEKLAQLVTLRADQLVVYLAVVDHQVITPAFGVAILLELLAESAEEEIDVINQDFLSRDCVRLLLFDCTDVVASLYIHGYLHILGLLDGLQDPLNESELVVELDLLEACQKCLIGFPRLQLSQAVKVHQPLVLIAEAVRDQRGQWLVPALDPLARVDSLRHMGQRLRE
jgi:hypothetical protein